MGRRTTTPHSLHPASRRRAVSRMRHAARRGTRTSKRGTIIIIGGGEDRSAHSEILSEVVRCLGSGRLIIATAGSNRPDEVWHEYAEAFRSLGVLELSHLHVNCLEDASSEDAVAMFKGASAIFFTDGEPLKITERLAATPLSAHILELYLNGGVIAGRSAGALTMGETMLVDDGRIAPGLGFVPNVVIDHHFTERGEIVRLLSAVAQHPGVLGVGIDKDTAIIIEDESDFRVIGLNSVYVVDGRHMTSASTTVTSPHHLLSMHNVRLHILASGEMFLLAERRPIASRVTS